MSRRRSKRDRGGVGIQMGDMLTQSRLEGDTQKASAIFKGGVDQINKNIARVTFSEDDRIRRQVNADLGKYLCDHVTHSRYFLWGIKEDGFVNLFFLKKRFLSPEEIESANTHYKQIDVFTKRFLNEHIKKNFPESESSLAEAKEENSERSRSVSDTSVSLLLEENGLLPSDIAPQPKLLVHPDSINPWPDAYLNLGRKTLLFRSRWHIKQSMSIWVPAGWIKARDVQFGIDKMQKVLVDHRREGSDSRPKNHLLEATLNRLCAISDRLMTHRKAIKGKKRGNKRGPEPTGSRVKNTRSGSIFLKCLTKDNNAYFLQLILKDLMRLHAYATLEKEKHGQKVPPIHEFVLTHTDSSQNYYDVSQAMLVESLRGNVIDPKNKLSMRTLMKVIRVWVMCRHIRTHHPGKEEQQYRDMVGTFFNRNPGEQRFQELKKESRNDNPFKALERYRRQERQSASRRSSP